MSEYITVGIPAYNGAKTIQNTLDGLLRQSYPWLNIIVSDNASEDETVEIVLRHAVTCDNRIKLLPPLEKNHGSAFNFLRLLNSCNTRYFMWNATDDVFHPTYIEKCYNRLKENPKLIGCCSDLLFVNERNEKQYYSNMCTVNMNAVERALRPFQRWGWFVFYSLWDLEKCKDSLNTLGTTFANDVLTTVNLCIRGEIDCIREPLIDYFLSMTPKPATGNTGGDTEIPENRYRWLYFAMLDVVARSDELTGKEKAQILNRTYPELSNDFRNQIESV